MARNKYPGRCYCRGKWVRRVSHEFWNGNEILVEIRLVKEKQNERLA